MTVALNRSLEEEIQTRIRLYDFSTGKQSFFEWQAGMLSSLEGRRVLEIGCGNGELWRSLIPRWSHCDVTLTDVSEGMLSIAQEQIGSLDVGSNSVDFKVLDFNQMNFDPASFDIIIANHNLFYANNLNELLSSISNSLTAKGVLICSTVSCDHLHELIKVLRQMNPDLPWVSESWSDKFGLENGGEQLIAHFDHIDQFEYDNNLHLSSLEPVMDYLEKMMKGSALEWIRSNREEILVALKQNMCNKGYLRLSPKSGFFVAKKCG